MVQGRKDVVKGAPQLSLNLIHHVHESAHLDILRNICKTTSKCKKAQAR